MEISAPPQADDLCEHRGHGIIWQCGQFFLGHHAKAQRGNGDQERQHGEEANDGGAANIGALSGLLE